MLETVPSGVSTIVSTGGITDADAVAELVDGVDVVVHAASYVGGYAELQQDVNVRGTRMVAQAAELAGVPRLIYVSTTGVYGEALHAGCKEDDFRPSPRSSLSKTRREAELIALAHNGTVVRPHFVIGEGDRWFLLPYLKLVLALGGFPNGGRVRTSVINRRTLGSAVASLATAPALSYRVYHASGRGTVLLGELAKIVVPALSEMSMHEVSAQDAMDVGVAQGIAAAQMRFAAEDSWIDAGRLWDEVDWTPNIAPCMTPNDVAWYMAALAPH